MRAGRARAHQLRERGRIEQRQVAGQHQPGDLRVALLRGEQPGHRPDVLVAIGDLRKARAQRLGSLVGAHRDVGPHHVRRSSAMARSSCGLPS